MFRYIVLSLMVISPLCATPKHKKSAAQLLIEQTHGKKDVPPVIVFESYIPEGPGIPFVVGAPPKEELSRAPAEPKRDNSSPSTLTFKKTKPESVSARSSALRASLVETYLQKR